MSFEKNIIVKSRAGKSENNSDLVKSFDNIIDVAIKQNWYSKKNILFFSAFAHDEDICSITSLMEKNTKNIDGKLSNKLFAVSVKVAETIKLDNERQSGLLPRFLKKNS